MRPRTRKAIHASGRNVTYDVRIWAIRTNEGKRRKTHSVRWIVAGMEFHDTYATWAQADSRRAELLSATKRGEAFDIEKGLPVSEVIAQNSRSWYEHAVAYVDRRWDLASGNSRRSIAESLTTVTPAFFSSERGRPDDETVRQALYGWAFNKARRGKEDPPEDVARALRWVERNTLSLANLANPQVMLGGLDAIARKKDGSAAAANTVARKRAVLHNVLEHAVGNGLEANPLPQAARLWNPPKTTENVDPQVVVNRRQAEALLDAVAKQGQTGRRLKAFFACMYYAGVRPGEAVELRRETNLDIPDEGWGTLYLRRSAPSVGSAWSDSGRRRERRQLKHRGDEEVRPVPCPPRLTELLHEHLAAKNGTAPDGRLFTGTYGGDLSESVYGRIWQAARKAALTKQEAESPLAQTPYDLRHACLSTWLNAGVDPTQVAEWAGNSVNVLLRVYAKCIAGREEAARRRIEEALEQDI